VLREGERYIGPSEEPASFEQVVEHARRTGVELIAEGRWNAPDNHWSFESGRGKPYFAYHFGAQVAEVSVDTGTGKVEVTGIWAAHNAGRSSFHRGRWASFSEGSRRGWVMP